MVKMLIAQLCLTLCDPKVSSGDRTSVFLSISYSDSSVPAALGQESQASSCLRKGTPLASRVAQGVSSSPRRRRRRRARARLSGLCCHRRRTWRWRSCSAGNSPLCEVMLRRLLRLRAGGGASARGREPWRRSCVPGNGWVAAAAAPCASPACLPAGRARPAPPVPMLVPKPGPRGRSSRWVSLPTPDLSVSSL